MEQLLEKKVYGYKIWEIIIFIIAFLLVLHCIKDFFDSIFLGFIIGYVLLPVYRKINKLIKHEIVSAIITLSLFYLPLFFMAWQVINWFLEELVSLYTQLASLTVPSLGGIFSIFNPAAIIWSILQKISDFFTSFFVTSPSKLLKFVIRLTIIIVISFFVLIEGSKWRQTLLRSLPREKRITLLKFIKRLDEIYYNIFVVQLYTAFIVFIIALIFFTLLRIKYILIYSTACFLFALIPIFDAWMVCLLIAMFSFLKGEIMKAVIISVVGSFLLSVVPGYIIRPKLAEKKAKVHGGLIFIAYLIGPFVFGPIGFLLAPAIFGFFQVVVEMILKREED